MTPYEKFKEYALKGHSKGTLENVLNNEVFQKWYVKIPEDDERKIMLPTFEEFAKWAFEKLTVNFDNTFEPYFNSRIYSDGYKMIDRKSPVVMGGFIENVSSKNTKYIRTMFAEDIYECKTRTCITLFEMMQIAYTSQFHVSRFCSCFFIPSMFAHYSKDLHNHTVYNDSIEISIYVNASNMSIFSPLVYASLLRYTNSKGNRNKNDLLVPSGSWGSPVIAAKMADYKEICVIDVQDNVLKILPKILDDVSKHDMFSEPLKLETFTIPSENMDTVLTKKYDQVFFCPPYFDLEIYSGSDMQSTDLYPDYEIWLEDYWEKTVKNCFEHMHNGATFSFVMSNITDDKYIGNDMLNIAMKYFRHIENVKIGTKVKTKLVDKEERYESCYILIKEEK